MVPEKIDCLQGFDRPIGRCPASMVVSCSSLAGLNQIQVRSQCDSSIRYLYKYPVHPSMEGRASHCDTKILRTNRTLFQVQRPSRQQGITSSEMCQFTSTLVPLFLPTVAFYLGPKWPKQSWLSDFFPRVSCLKWCQLTSAIQSAKGRALWASSAK